MSKIYKALEKAEREREEESKRSLPIISEFEKEKKNESQEMAPVLSETGGIISDPKLVSMVQSGSLAAEQFRKLRNYLLRFNIKDSRKTIMVTSAMSGEGKTFVSANLAISISHELHAHAVLVDCDLRNPTLTQWFGLQSGEGLSDYLAGDGNPAKLFRQTSVEKLNLLSAGAIRDNPTELIGSKKMEALVQELKSRYTDRYIIFDSTPLLATTEPEVLAKLVDGIVIVVRAGVTSRETIKQAIASLDKEKIIGFVLNHVQFKSPGLSSRYFGTYGYYYRYGYGYKYGHGKSKVKPPKSQWGKLLWFIRKSD